MPPALTTTRAPELKAARRLAKRSARSAERLFLAEGPQAVREALGRPEVVTRVFATEEAARRHPELAAAALEAGVGWHLVSGSDLASLAQTVTPQGVVAVCRHLDVPLSVLTTLRPCLVAVCVSVRDPGNVGTVIRCADAAGADAVVAAGTTVEVYNGKAVRASAGSLFHLPVCVAPSVPETVEAMRSAGLSVLAADARGDTDLDSASAEALLGGPTGWLFGNEAWGLPPDVSALGTDPDLRPSREPEPGSGGGGVPVRVGTRAKPSGPLTGASGRLSPSLALPTQKGSHVRAQRRLRPRRGRGAAA
jgi:TrmH family RNA methyltransferase